MAGADGGRRGADGEGPGYRPGAGRPTPRRRGSGGVLLGGRYVVTGAIRQGAEGGVFLGRDTDGGAEVVVKQARAHIEVDRAGTDARAALRHEAALLARLEGLRLAPRPVELVEQDDSLFLVQERIAGQPLGGWVTARLRRYGSPDVDWAEAGPMAHALLDLVERVHEQGLVLRGLCPGNVLVRPDGSLRLVDLESATEAGSRAGSAGAPGYRAPEQGPGRLALVTGDGATAPGTRSGGPFAGLAAGRRGDGARTAEPEADLYALGGLLFLLATGHDPLLPEDLPHARPVADRLGRWLALAARCGTTARRLAPAVLGLRAEHPHHRWTTTRVRESLTAAPSPWPEPPDASDGITVTEGAPDDSGEAHHPADPWRPAPGGGARVTPSSFWETEAPEPDGAGNGHAAPPSAHEAPCPGGPDAPRRPSPPNTGHPDGPSISRATREHAHGPGAHEIPPPPPPATAGPDAPSPARPQPAGRGASGDGGAAVLDQVLHDGLRHLAATATPSRWDRLWPVVPAGERSDPCNVQHGAAGVLAVLARAAATTGLPGVVRESARTTTRIAANWIERRCAAEPAVLPGLHCGRSGAAWALLDAAGALGDHALAGRAAELADRIAVEWPNPDVRHGAAGSGFLQLRFAAHDLNESVAGPPWYLSRALRCGQGLLAAAREAPYGTVWPVPQDFNSALAGTTRLGFAHGVAGIGTFLLAAAEAIDETSGTFTGEASPGGALLNGARLTSALFDGARAAGRTLATTARPGSPAADRGPTAWWPQSADDPGHVRLAHGCSGSSGVGTFLVRLWRATGDAEAHRLAVAAGRAVIADRWHSDITACHGLAGGGEFLLDLAHATGDPEFHSAAQEFGSLIAARSALRDGLLVLPDETGTGTAAAYGTGTAGALAFLLRLRHGGPRLWVDPAAPNPTGAVAA
ncbi:hypothetical protein GCM10009639_36000 [Kitasatospora putterlickiae]|uniref:non-specific serine/threonine protein kinase n=1 Tax=Kitasatospora putterlickiae TaxID=221725 RepID=A0ABN1Y6Y4_9ACTN